MVWSVCIFFIITVPLSYYIHFHKFGLSNNPESWGQFGDFFGGVLNPIISLINLIILTYLSIRVVKIDEERNKWTLQELAKPFGDISFDKSPWSISIQIHNCGLGPMIIKEISIINDDGQVFNNFSPIVKPNNPNINVTIGAFKINNQCVISKDSELNILDIQGDKNDHIYLQYIKDIDLKLKDYRIEVKYQDMYHRQMETLIERITLSFIDVE